MSRRVIGYHDRRPVYEDLGPASARRQGFGGSAMGFYSSTILTIGPSKAVRSAAAQRAVERKRQSRAQLRGGLE
jgi:hypothetical protein